MSKAKSKVKLNPEVLEENNEVVNEVDESATKEYLAWCSFTTIALNPENGKYENMVINKDEIVTAARVPQAWLDLAESQRFLISVENHSKWDDKTRTANGYL